MSCLLLYYFFCSFFFLLVFGLHHVSCFPFNLCVMCSCCFHCRILDFNMKRQKWLQRLHRSLEKVFFIDLIRATESGWPARKTIKGIPYQSAPSAPRNAVVQKYQKKNHSRKRAKVLFRRRRRAEDSSRQIEKQRNGQKSDDAEAFAHRCQGQLCQRTAASTPTGGPTRWTRLLHRDAYPKGCGHGGLLRCTKHLRNTREGKCCA